MRLTPRQRTGRTLLLGLAVRAACRAKGPASHCNGTVPTSAQISCRRPVGAAAEAANGALTWGRPTGEQLGTCRQAELRLVLVLTAGYQEV